ncbi:MAG: guanylate kinase [Firmicutes bacterium]|nr:guanylate kinase [Clostridiales bacterium]MBQ9932053.1 guanylate kinase [Bacillota bacterium]
MQRGSLFVLSGPSGAGKGTICQKLLADTDIHLSISMTTRQPRQGEVHGISYYFTEEEDFLARVEAGGFLEYANVFGRYYGTPRDAVLEKLNEGKDVLLEIDVQGALQVKENFPEGILIFVLPPSLEELKKRIVGRGTETEDAIATRLGKALQEISFLDRYDYYVVNDDLDQAVDEVKSIIRSQSLKVADRAEALIAQYKEEN